MEIKEIHINDLKPAEYNPRSINKKEFEGLVNSIKKFGVVDPIIVNKDLTIIGGHQRYEALKQLKFETVPCNVLDLNKHDEKKLNILLNSQKISGRYDDLKLSELLEELKLDDDYLDLNLDELEPLDLSSNDEYADNLDYSDKNKEININDLGTQSISAFKFDHQSYLNVLDLLNNAKEKLECETNEETLITLLKQYA